MNIYDSGRMPSQDETVCDVMLMPEMRNLLDETSMHDYCLRMNDRAVGARTEMEEYDMATEVILPKLGFSMNEGNLAEWLIADGGEVEAGQPLFALESDKSTQEVEAPASGTLKILKEAGETYEVGTILGEIV